MFEIIGKYNQATVYAATVDGEAYAQVLRMCNREELKDCRIRMMPDMHAAEGCTVGTSTFYSRMRLSRALPPASPQLTSR